MATTNEDFVSGIAPLWGDTSVNGLGWLLGSSTLQSPNAQPIPTTNPFKDNYTPNIVSSLSNKYSKESKQVMWQNSWLNPNDFTPDAFNKDANGNMYIKSTYRYSDSAKANLWKKSGMPMDSYDTNAFDKDSNGDLIIRKDYFPTVYQSVPDVSKTYSGVAKQQQGALKEIASKPFEPSSDTKSLMDEYGKLQDDIASSKDTVDVHSEDSINEFNSKITKLKSLGETINSNINNESIEQKQKFKDMQSNASVLVDEFQNQYTNNVGSILSKSDPVFSRQYSEARSSKSPEFVSQLVQSKVNEENKKNAEVKSLSDKELDDKMDELSNLVPTFKPLNLLDNISTIVGGYNPISQDQQQENAIELARLSTEKYIRTRPNIDEMRKLVDSSYWSLALMDKIGQGSFLWSTVKAIGNVTWSDFLRETGQNIQDLDTASTEAIHENMETLNNMKGQSLFGIGTWTAYAVGIWSLEFIGMGKAFAPISKWIDMGLGVIPWYTKWAIVNPRVNAHLTNTLAFSALNTGIEYEAEGHLPTAEEFLSWVVMMGAFTEAPFVINKGMKMMFGEPMYKFLKNDAGISVEDTHQVNRYIDQFYKENPNATSQELNRELMSLQLENGTTLGDAYLNVKNKRLVTSMDERMGATKVSEPTKENIGGGSSEDDELANYTKIYHWGKWADEISKGNIKILTPQEKESMSVHNNGRYEWLSATSEFDRATNHANDSWGKVVELYVNLDSRFLDVWDTHVDAYLQEHPSTRNDYDILKSNAESEYRALNDGAFLTKDEALSHSRESNRPLTKDEKDIADRLYSINPDASTDQFADASKSLLHMKGVREELSKDEIKIGSNQEQKVMVDDTIAKLSSKDPNVIEEWITQAEDFGFKREVRSPYSVVAENLGSLHNIENKASPKSSARIRSILKEATVDLDVSGNRPSREVFTNSVFDKIDSKTNSQVDRERFLSWDSEYVKEIRDRFESHLTKRYNEPTTEDPKKIRDSISKRMKKFMSRDKKKIGESEIDEMRELYDEYIATNESSSIQELSAFNEKLSAIELEGKDEWLKRKCLEKLELVEAYGEITQLGKWLVRLSNHLSNLKKGVSWMTTNLSNYESIVKLITTWPKGKVFSWARRILTENTTKARNRYSNLKESNLFPHLMDVLYRGSTPSKALFEKLWIDHRFIEKTRMKFHVNVSDIEHGIHLTRIDDDWVHKLMNSQEIEGAVFHPRTWRIFDIKDVERWNANVGRGIFWRRLKPSEYVVINKGAIEEYNANNPDKKLSIQKILNRNARYIESLPKDIRHILDMTESHYRNYSDKVYDITYKEGLKEGIVVRYRKNYVPITQRLIGWEDESIYWNPSIMKQKLKDDYTYSRTRATGGVINPRISKIASRIDSESIRAHMLESTTKLMNFSDILNGSRISNLRSSKALNEYVSSLSPQERDTFLSSINNFDSRRYVQVRKDFIDRIQSHWNFILNGFRNTWKPTSFDNIFGSIHRFNTFRAFFTNYKSAFNQLPDLVKSYVYNGIKNTALGQRDSLMMKWDELNMFSNIIEESRVSPQSFSWDKSGYLINKMMNNPTAFPMTPFDLVVRKPDWFANMRSFFTKDPSNLSSLKGSWLDMKDSTIINSDFLTKLKESNPELFYKAIWFADAQVKERLGTFSQFDRAPFWNSKIGQALLPFQYTNMNNFMFCMDEMRLGIATATPTQFAKWLATMASVASLNFAVNTLFMGGVYSGLLGVKGIYDQNSAESKFLKSIQNSDYGEALYYSLLGMWENAIPMLSLILNEGAMSMNIATKIGWDISQWEYIKTVLDSFNLVLGWVAKQFTKAYLENIQAHSILAPWDNGIETLRNTPLFSGMSEKGWTYVKGLWKEMNNEWPYTPSIEEQVASEVDVWKIKTPYNRIDDAFRKIDFKEVMKYGNDLKLVDYNKDAIKKSLLASWLSDEDIKKYKKEINDKLKTQWDKLKLEKAYSLKDTSQVRLELHKIGDEEIYAKYLAEKYPKREDFNKIFDIDHKRLNLSKDFIFNVKKYIKDNYDIVDWKIKKK